MKKINKQDLKSAMIIAFSLVIMMGSLYVGFTKGRIDEAGAIKDNIKTPGLEELVINKDNIPNPGDTALNNKEDVNPSKNNTPITSEEYKEPDKVEKKNQEETKETSSEIVKISLNYPVKSKKIVMDYSYNTDPVYSKTFNEYRSDHCGIDFKANIGDDVFAAADGEITKIYEDERLGYTVVISHDGCESHYSNLDQAFTVKIGDKVSKGDTIGTVGKSAVYELAEDSHVHFGVYINGECADPKSYL